MNRKEQQQQHANWILQFKGALQNCEQSGSGHFGREEQAQWGQWWWWVVKTKSRTRAQTDVWMERRQPEADESNWWWKETGEYRNCVRYTVAHARLC